VSGGGAAEPAPARPGDWHRAGVGATGKTMAPNQVCARSDMQCRNESPLRHRFDIRSDISLSQCVSERRIKPLENDREFGFGQS
jgi:hypothetical protein